MKKQGFVLVAVWFALLCVFAGVAWAGTQAAPTVDEIAPSTVSNAVDTALIITGTGFTSVPSVSVDSTQLGEVGWASTTTLTATVPWGLEPGVYTVTVENPDGEAGLLARALTVTEGFEVWTTGGPYGGQVVELVTHPLSPTTVFAVVFQVGVFASYDAGASWQMILVDDWPTRLSFDAVDGDVIYAGGDGGGLLCTQDGGESWDPIAPFEKWQYWEQHRPAAHPITTGVVYDGKTIPDEPALEAGLYWSADFGDNWLTRTAGMTDTQVIDIVFHPQDASRMLAGTLNGNLYESDDGGLAWTWKADLNREIRRLYYDPSGGDVAWAVSRRPEPPLPSHTLFRTEDMTNWEPVTVEQEVYALAFISDTLWAAAGGLFTSTDDGQNWEPVNAPGLPRQDHRSIQDVTSPLGDAATIYAGDWGEGAWKSSDGGATFAEHNNGLAGVVPMALAVTPLEPDIVYANTAGRGLFKSNNGGDSWLSLDRWVGGPSPAHFMAVDPFTPTRVYLGGACPDEFCIEISENGGVDWRPVSVALPLTWDGWSTMDTVVAPHPRQPGRILAGANLDDGGGGDWWQDPARIFGSDDYGESWTYLGPGQPISMVNEFAYDAVDDDLVYAATHGSGLWMSRDGGQAWQRVTAFPGERRFTSVAAHPDISNTVYILAEDQQGSNIYVSEDAGATWDHVTDHAGVQLTITPPGPGADDYALHTSCGSPVRGVCRIPAGSKEGTLLPNSPRPTSLAAGGAGERVMLYIGSPGGVLEDGGAATFSVGEMVPGKGQVLGAGVYRYLRHTQAQPPPSQTGWYVYLPLMLKDHN